MSSLLQHQISREKGIQQLLGEAQPGSNGINVGFPSSDRPSAFQAVVSQVPQGWDVNFRHRWSRFTNLINIPQNFNKINFRSFRYNWSQVWKGH